MKKLLLILALFVCAQSFAQTKKKTATVKKTAVVVQAERMVEITTNYGTIVVKLYNGTPLHRDNFIKLVKQKFYDSTTFHRVIKGFMIQGGDPLSKSQNPDSLAMVGNGQAPGERIPAEFNASYVHKKGALAAARDNNPEKASSNCQFYIVQGNPVPAVQLNEMECKAVRANNPEFAYTDAQRNAYKTIGGTPFLDQNYTVFGEVVKGLEVMDKITEVAKAANDKPIENVWMKMKMLN